jgi:hypothetical protein
MLVEAAAPTASKIYSTCARGCMLTSAIASGGRATEVISYCLLGNMTVNHYDCIGPTPPAVFGWLRWKDKRDHSGKVAYYTFVPEKIDEQLGRCGLFSIARLMFILERVMRDDPDQYERVPSLVASGTRARVVEDAIKLIKVAPVDDNDPLDIDLDDPATWPDFAREVLSTTGFERIAVVTGGSPSQNAAYTKICDDIDAYFADCGIEVGHSKFHWFRKQCVMAMIIRVGAPKETAAFTHQTDLSTQQRVYGAPQQRVYGHLCSFVCVCSLCAHLL